jgi:hypothetical protein
LFFFFSSWWLIRFGFPVSRSILLWFSHLFSSLFSYCCFLGLFLTCIFNFSPLFYPSIFYYVFFFFLWFQTKCLTYTFKIIFLKNL